MEKEVGKICAEGFTFFSKTNRLISHELKNILAIISETMGLLDELLELSESGRGLSPERLRSMSASIIEEVERANTVIRCMNTFAHSVDEMVREVNLEEAVALTIQIVGLNPISRAVKIDFRKTGSKTVYTSPFFLENLLYLTFHFALSAADTDKRIRVSLLADGAGAGVEIYGIAPGGFRSFPTQQAALLAKAIGADISFDDASGKLRIGLPQKMTGGPIETLPIKLQRD